MAFFKCDWCEEEYDVSIKFHVITTEMEEHLAYENVCPDCIAKLFIEDPEQIIKIKKYKEA